MKVMHRFTSDTTTEASEHKAQPSAFSPQRAVIGLTLLALMTFIISSCASQSSSQTAANTIEKYLNSLVEKDLVTFQSVVCAEYESAALTEYDSFGAVDANLEDATCKVSQSQDDSAVVTCTGNINIVYKGENNNSLDLSRTPYRVVKEDGEWKMCGYAQ